MMPAEHHDICPGGTPDVGSVADAEIGAACAGAARVQQRGLPAQTYEPVRKLESTCVYVHYRPLQSARARFGTQNSLASVDD